MASNLFSHCGCIVVVLLLKMNVGCCLIFSINEHTTFFHLAFHMLEKKSEKLQEERELVLSPLLKS